MSKREIDNVLKVFEDLNEETREHSKRVGMYTQAFCTMLGMNKAESYKISIAAMTHDLGKMHIPASILEKPAKLTEEEFDIIKSHPELGHKELLKNKELLQQSDEQFKITLEVALSHHEKHNGKGYPHGLKGDEIPFEAQVVSVVDVFDALSCERVYKKTWNQEEVNKYMKDHRAEAFNPVLSDTFLENEDVFFKLKEYIGNNKNISIDNFQEETINFLKRQDVDVSNKNSFTEKLLESQSKKRSAKIS